MPFGPPKVISPSARPVPKKVQGPSGLENGLTKDRQPLAAVVELLREHRGEELIDGCAVVREDDAAAIYALRSAKRDRDEPGVFHRAVLTCDPERGGPVAETRMNGAVVVSVLTPRIEARGDMTAAVLVHWSANR